MANYLRLSMQQTILALNSKGWSKRRISREVGLNRRTVTKYIKQLDSKCTISTAGSEGRKSLCLKHHNFIEKSIINSFSAQRIYRFSQ